MHLLETKRHVLILVLVEDGLVDSIWVEGVDSKVLILVLVEDGLVVSIHILLCCYRCLNPCFSGGWSSGFF